MGKPTLRVIFNSYVSHYERVTWESLWQLSATTCHKKKWVSFCAIMLLSGPVWYMDIINWLSLIVPFTILCLWLSNMDKYGGYPSWINEPNPRPNIASGFFNSGLGDDIFNQPNMANGKPNLQKTCRRRGPWWSQSRPTVLAAIGGRKGSTNTPWIGQAQQVFKNCIVRGIVTMDEINRFNDRHRCTKNVQTITTCTGKIVWNAHTQNADTVRGGWNVWCHGPRPIASDSKMPHLHLAKWTVYGDISVFYPYLHRDFPCKFFFIFVLLSPGSDLETSSPRVALQINCSFWLVI